MSSDKRFSLLLVAWMCAALCVLPGRGSATDYFVAPTGPGGGGTNWATAFSNAQDAATLATNAGDKIYLQCGVYSNASQLVISNAAGLTIVGGCVGNGTNDYSGTNSTLTKTGGVMRIVYGYASTATLSGLTISGGYFVSGTNSGAGLYFTNCAVTLTNCVVSVNTNLNTSSSSSGYGGGLYCSGGSLGVYDCVFSNNDMRHSAGSISAGGALAGINTPLTIAGTLFVTNKASVNDTCYGGAIYSSGAQVVITNCEFRGNYAVSMGQWGYGGAVHISGGAALIACSTFSSNSAGSSGRGNGGALYLTGLPSAIVRSNYFFDNYFWGDVGCDGSALFIVNCATSIVDECVIESRSRTAYAEHVYIGGGTNTFILNTIVRSNGYTRGIWFAGAAAASLVMTNCQIMNNAGDGLLVSAGTVTVANCTLANNTWCGLNWSNAAGTLGLTNCLVINNGSDGIRLTGGTATVAHCTLANNMGCGASLSNASGALGLTNCLLAQNAGDGLLVSAGTVTVANCTLAYNGSWGFNRAGGTGTVFNSIAWGNSVGGFVSNASLGVTYSCSQNAPYGIGTGNILADPVFAPVAGYYYLSETNLAEQTNHSPCIDAGFGLASVYGLDTRTTRTDGTNDSGIVDMGYHYTNSVAVPHLVPVCYVDGVGGDNGNSGLAWTSAWKSVTHAMTNVAANGTINLATGVYSFAATAESFPLTVQMANLTLAASNSLPALTVLDNAGTSGRRVLQAIGKGTILLKGLTFRGGCFASGENNGAGLYFQSCAGMLTNCVVSDNTNLNTSTVAGCGGGLYCSGGSLGVYDCVFSNNDMRHSAGGYVSAGGALAGINTPLTIAGTLFVTNKASVNDVCYGGAIYSSGAQVVITNCEFRGNYAVSMGQWGYGGAVHISGGAAIIACSTFSSNSAGSVGRGNGGALYLTGLPSAIVRSNYFFDNYFWGDVVCDGSALFIVNCATSIVDECVIESRSRTAYAEHVYIGGGTNTFILNTIVRSNGYTRGIWFAGAAAASLVMTNCQIMNNAGDGILLTGGTATVACCTLANNAGRGVSCSNAAGALGLTNCLLAKNGGDGLLFSAGTAAVANCTFANNLGWGIARPTSAGLTVKNSIVWGNSRGGIGHNQSLTLTYTDSQDGWAPGLGIGNLSADPLFVDAAGGDYHEMGVEGSYHGGGWTPDARNSPCLDAGDPASDWSLEPKPCGNRINMGAYGNTAEATRSLPKTGTVMRVW